uniref:Uncharacterized protein n=1 Tax=Oryza sativa subsp. japonica TaxID=39947 RepID=Q652F2_ORYSJ|nr:hypothetical protein [Oryza sativa Japonica Group]BAD46315.1 hypothetical protein [Oryza sativa Japonica Group]
MEFGWALRRPMRLPDSPRHERGLPAALRGVGVKPERTPRKRELDEGSDGSGAWGEWEGGACVDAVVVVGEVGGGGWVGGGGEGEGWREFVIVVTDEVGVMVVRVVEKGR